MRRRAELLLVLVPAVFLLSACSDPFPPIDYTCLQEGTCGTCEDAFRNFKEVDVDCGGPNCPACGEGRRCTAEVDCLSGVCEKGMCTAPNECQDLERNGQETDLNCGGSSQTCPRCEAGKMCLLDRDCASMHCQDKLCAVPPNAGFSLSEAGTAPSTVTATSSAMPGPSPIATTEYAWDDGLGFEPSTSHLYTAGGTYTVLQRVTAEDGISAIHAETVTVGGFTPVRFSATDIMEHVLLSVDRLAVEHRPPEPSAGGVRSDSAIAPRSGVFYFEVERLIEEVGAWGFGVGTLEEDLRLEIGHGPEPDTAENNAQTLSMGILTLGSVHSDAGTCTQRGFPVGQKHYGFVIDYRGDNPKMHLILDDMGTPTLATTCTMPTTEPLYILYTGARFVVGFQARINTGADTTNIPFHFTPAQVGAALTTGGEATAAASIVYGFGVGKTRSLPMSAAPTLAPPGDMSVALERPVTLTATAMDAEDGNLSNKIWWREMTSQHHAPLQTVGPSFTFTPTAIGKHPVRLSVRDSVGKTTTHTMFVTVTGTLPQASRVELVSGCGETPCPEEADEFGSNARDVTLLDENLSARFNGLGKYGVRANQGIYGDFWYFEAHRQNDEGNMGLGVVIKDGAINPYHFDNVPWSCSINLSGNTWRNLISQSNWAPSNDSYGFAVDYRGDHPIVHIIVGRNGMGRLQSTMTLDDVWVPLYPMLYGNPQEEGLGPDITANFGASPFRFNPRAILGVGAELQLGWGVHQR